MIDDARALACPGGSRLVGRSPPQEFAKMPRPLSVLVAAVAAPLFGLAIHAAVPAHGAGAPAAHAASLLPHNLCASCHGGGRVVSAMPQDALDMRDLIAASAYLQKPPRA
jgi:hypothetical protein